MLAKQAGASPDTPHLLRRLAEDYSELEAAGRNSPGDPTVRKSRVAAIHFYEELLRQYPISAQLDAVSYYLAYEYERDGDMPNARRVYSALNSKFPNSQYVPLAYFGLGEIALRESAVDPTKLADALRSYQSATQWPALTNDACAWAWVRLGQVFERQGDRTEARTKYATALAFAQQNPTSSASSGIAAAIPSWAQP